LRSLQDQSQISANYCEATFQPQYFTNTYNAKLGGEFHRTGQTIYRGPVVLNRRDVRSASQGQRILMDHYGLSHESEFFAVASELYFQMPETLAEYHPNVYVLLRDFYVTELHSFPET
jgi:Mlc titration factor MtfA (ptsG expression regulator)